MRIFLFGSRFRGNDAFGHPPMPYKPVTAEQMSEIDRRARDEYGIAQSILMENAGRAVADEIIRDLGGSTDHSQQSTMVEKPRIAVFCGKGNNGGDGFVAARILHERGVEVIVYAAETLKMKEGAAAENLNAAARAGIDIHPLSDFQLEGLDIAVDAMFGTGFKGEFSGKCAVIGKTLNAAGIKIYAVDIPSGLDGTTGKAAVHTPKAYKTVTFGLPKTGFFINDGPRLCGEVVVKDIGFPPELLQEYI